MTLEPLVVRAEQVNGHLGVQVGGYGKAILRFVGDRVALGRDDKLFLAGLP